MAAIFSEPRPRRFFNGQQEYEIKIQVEQQGSNTQLFQHWLASSTDEAVSLFFQSVSEGLASRQLEHYHFKICNGQYNEWYIQIFYGGTTEQEGPLQVSRCMSCDMDCPLILGVLGEAGATAAAAAAAAAVPPPRRPPAPPRAAAGITAAQPDHAAAAAAGAETCDAVVDGGKLDAAATAGAAAGAANDNLLAACGSTDACGTQQQQQQQQQQQDTPRPRHAGQQAQQQAQQQQQQQYPGPVSRDSLLKETEHCRVWWDAKARPMWVVTPKPHLERLADLSQPQLVDLFRTAAGVVGDMGCRSFETMILNHGDSRNHAHLHLKVRVHKNEFQRAVARLLPRQRAQLQAMQRLADSLPPEAQGTSDAYQLRQQQRQQRQQQQQPGPPPQRLRQQY